VTSAAAAERRTARVPQSFWGCDATHEAARQALDAAGIGIERVEHDDEA
jgi:hypothetical protein